MRTNFTTEDVKNIIDVVFNGNLSAHKASKGAIPYENPNSEQIRLTEAETGAYENVDLAEYLNINFYSWKERLVTKDTTGFDTTSLVGVEDWVASLNFSTNEAYALVETIDEEVVPSQDIDSATITGKITFLIQTNKIKNLDYYVAKVRNSYLGNPQDLQNSYGDTVKAYINVGRLLYEEAPLTMQLGEVLIVSLNFSINYLSDALTYSDCQVLISLDGDDTYDETGAVVGTSKYLSMPLTSATFQDVFISGNVPKMNRPDLTGAVVSSLSTITTLTFYDFNKELTQRLNALFWSRPAHRINGILTTVQDVNVPVYLKVVSEGNSYVYKDVIENMQKNISNNDFNISSITLRGWGK